MLLIESQIPHPTPQVRVFPVRPPACAILKAVEPVGSEVLVDGIGPIGMGL